MEDGRLLRQVREVSGMILAFKVNKEKKAPNRAKHHFGAIRSSGILVGQYVVFYMLCCNVLMKVIINIYFLQTL